MKKFNHTFTRIIIMSASGCLLIFFAGRYTPARVLLPPPAEAEAVSGPVSDAASGSNDSFVSRILEHLDAFSDKASARGEKKEAKEYEPSVLKYNLVNLFPEENTANEPETEDADIRDIFDNMLKPLYQKLNISAKANVKSSYGGQMYELLNQRDAEWTSRLYQWIQATPEQAAKRLNLPSSAALGRYNPVNPLHKAEEPGSWLVPSWKNINVNFYDGDGKRIDLYSNSREIVSLASVNTFYTGWQDVEKFKAYIERLWDASHSYSVSISDVYYCDGCVDPSVVSEDSLNRAENGVLTSDVEKNPPEATKASENASDASQKPSQAQETQPSGGNTAEKVTQTPAASSNSPSGSTSGSTSGLSPSSPPDTAPNSSSDAAPAAKEEGSSAAAAVISGQPETVSQESKAAGDSQSAGNTGNAGNSGGTGNSESTGNTGNPGSTGNTGSTGNPGNAGAGDTGSTKPAGPASDTADSVPVGTGTEDGTETMAENGTVTESNAANSQPGFQTQSAMLETQAPSETKAESEQTGGQLLAGADTQAEANSKTASTPEIKLNAEGKFCPGHMDLTITARIVGLSEKKNLFALDKPSKNEGTKEWTPYGKAYVEQLYSQDWKEEYGLSAMDLALGKPLTSIEISNYMSLLPAGTSLKRRTVIAYALNSVGKIPYYYGGKPSSAGYDNNNFSTLTKPDQKGRILKGLDCSGWVNWVYWSAIGERLNALGTSGLIYAGRPVSREALKPGDIIVKPGLNSHVVMFMSWASNGSMICIHETGSTINNVTVSTLDAHWPYYRALLD